MYLYLGLFILVLGLVLYIISYYLYSKELNKVYTKLDVKQKATLKRMPRSNTISIELLEKVQTTNEIITKPINHITKH